jgi:hypothetical protein
MSDPILKWFSYEHLPLALQNASRPFAELAGEISQQYAPSAERSTVLRKLLEAKDAAVRAHIETMERDAGST